MKKSFLRFCLFAGFALLALAGQTTALMAAEEDRGGPGERLDRLEQRINEMAQRQEQLMRQFGNSPQPQGPMPGQMPQNMRRRMGPNPQMTPSMDQPMNPPMNPQMGPPVNPPMLEVHRDIAGFLKLMMLVGIICNILLAVWIFGDIRKRGEGSGIFVALALVAGIPAAIIYSLVRLGDRKP
jgi:hypothetical protein